MPNFHILKSRGIIRNENGDIFLAFIPKAGFFCLPGGTMEPGARASARVLNAKSSKKQA